jgi:multidrug efflux pump subunit AcrB
LRGVRAVLTLLFANPLRTVALSMELPALGFLTLPTLTPQFFPGVDHDQFDIEVDLPPGTGIEETLRVVREIDGVLAAQNGFRDVGWLVGRSAPAFYYNMVGDRSDAPAFAQALIRSVGPAETERLLATLQASLPPRFAQVRFVIRGLTQGPPVTAPLELRLVGQEIDALRRAHDDLRVLLTEVSSVAVLRTGIAGGVPKMTLQVDGARARLLRLDLGWIARQMEAGLEGITGGSLLEGTEELLVRVRLGAGLQGDPVAIGDMPILPPGAAQMSAAGQFPTLPLSTLGPLRLEPSKITITRRNGKRVNTVQAYLLPGVLPAVALAEAMALVEARDYAPPQGIRLETGGDSHARDSTVQDACGASWPDRHSVDCGGGDDPQLFPADADRLCRGGPVGGAIVTGLGVVRLSLRDQCDHRGARVHRRVDQRGPDRAVGIAEQRSRRSSETGPRWSMWWQARPGTSSRRRFRRLVDSCR